MQPWMNYSTNSYQQYQTPMYQPMQNPYMDNRLNNLQQFQQNLQPAQISGANQGLSARIVDTFDSITANDVPMNGGALFVKNDGSEIQFRAWQSDGTISKTQYLAHKDDSASNTVKSSDDKEKLKFDTFNEVLEGISSKVDSLSDRLDEFMKAKQVSKSKKEVSADE